MQPSNPSPLRSLTRLMVGGALLGWEELQHQLHLWEHTARQTSTPSPLSNPLTTSEQHVSESGQVDTTHADHQVPLLLPASPPTAAQAFRYALVGLLFDTQERAEQGLAVLEQIDHNVGNWISPLLQSVEQNQALAPMQKQFAELVARGEAEVNRLVALGQGEEMHSRLLTQSALRKTFEQSIHHIAIDPEVQDLIQRQGTGLATEVIEEVRERTVSIDTFMERLARMLLRRGPREELPEPPIALRIRAEHFRSTE